MSNPFRALLCICILTIIGSAVHAQKQAPFVGEWRATTKQFKGKPLSITHLTGDLYSIKTEAGAFTAVALGKSLGYYSEHQQGLWTYTLTDENHIALTVKFDHDLAGAMKPLTFERAGISIKPMSGAQPATVVKTSSGCYLKSANSVLVGPYDEIHKLKDGRFLIRAASDWRLADIAGKFSPGQPFSEIKKSAAGIAAKRGGKWLQLGPEAHL